MILLFTNKTRSSLQWVMAFLHHYEVISGQLISQDKNNFYIGRLASASCWAIVHSVTDFQWHQLPFSYLGCLIFTGNSRFDMLFGKFEVRLGFETLI